MWKKTCSGVGPTSSLTCQAFDLTRLHPSLNYAGERHLLSFEVFRGVWGWTENIVQLIEWLPGMHKALGLIIINTT